MKGDGVPKYTCLDCKLMFCKEHFKKGAAGRCIYCTETLRMHNIPSFMQDLDNMDGMAAEDIDFSINVDKNHEEYIYYPYKAGNRLRVGPRLQSKLRCKEYMEVVKQDTPKGDYEKAEDLAEKLPYEWCLIPEDDNASVGVRALNQIGNSLQDEDVAQKRRHRIMRLMKVKRMVECKLERLYYKTIEIPEERPAQPANPN